MTNSNEHTSSNNDATGYDDDPIKCIAMDEKKGQTDVPLTGANSSGREHTFAEMRTRGPSHHTLSATSIPPGNLDEHSFCHDVEKSEGVEIRITHGSKVFDCVNIKNRGEEIVSPEKIERSSDVRVTPEQGLSEPATNPKADSAIISFPTVNLVTSGLPIPHDDYESADDKKSEKYIIPKARQKRPREHVLTRPSEATAPESLLECKIRQRFKLPVSGNRMLAHRKLYLDEELETQSDTSGEKESDEQPDEEVIQNSTNVVYSWDSLRLGEELGSAAINDYFACANVGRAPKLTSRQVLQIISSMRVKTILPPKGSILHQIVHKNRVVQEDYTRKHGNHQNTPGSPLKIPFETLDKVYETMCLQDIDDGSANRREVQYMNVDMLLAKFRSFENQACDLKMREEEVMAQAQVLGGGLIDKKLVYQMMGYCDGRENWRPIVQNQKTPNLPSRMQAASI